MLETVEGDEAERDRVLFGVMLATGIRVGSALGLDVEDVDLDRGELYLRSTKGDRPMTVHFNERVGALLRGHIRDRVSGPLFESRHGRPLSSRQVQRRLAHWCKEAGIQRPTFPHALRHTFATNLYRRTGDPFLLQRALGHASMASTANYCRCEEERLRRALA